MRARPLFFFILFLIALFIFFKIDHFLREGVLSLGDKIKGGFFDTKEKIMQTYENYFNQAKTISKQSQELKELERIKLQNIEIQSELNHLLQFYNMPSVDLSNLFPVRVISFADFGKYRRVWLGGYEGEREGFYGLILQGYVVGIAKKNEEGRMVGYLNGDSLCSYGVYVGKQKALGMIKNQDDALLVDYIPLGSDIQVGDEVVTNGLDGIFFPNIPVGKVEEVTMQNGYLSARIKPFSEKIELGYMWLLDRRNQ